MSAAHAVVELYRARLERTMSALELAQLDFRILCERNWLGEVVFLQDRLWYWGDHVGATECPDGEWRSWYETASDEEMLRQRQMLGAMNTEQYACEKRIAALREKRAAMWKAISR